MLPEWLRDTVQTGTSLLWWEIGVRLLAAFALGCLVAGIYRVTISDKDDSTAFLATLVLLCVLIAVVTLVIGSSVALAFSLVGALSIVRFRTVVEDTRDTAYVIFAVITGMAAGSGSVVIPLMAAPLVLLASWLFRPRPVVEVEQKRGLLILRLAAVKPPEEPVRAALEKHLGGGRLTGLSTARGGSALDVTYSVTLPTPEVAVALLAELSRIEGVQGVELKER